MEQAVTEAINAMIGAHERTAYTIEHRGDCVLITGAVPVTALSALIKLVPKNSVMSPDVARIWGATFAFGPEEDLQELREAGEIVAMQREKQANPCLPQDALQWLAFGERGISSETILSCLTGANILHMHKWSHPYDPADFRRCRLLLEAVPELADRLHMMSAVSPQWAALVRDWHGICTAMDAEIPNWRTPKSSDGAPHTYELIKAAIGQ